MPSRRRNKSGSGTGKPSVFSHAAGNNKSGMHQTNVVNTILINNILDSAFIPCPRLNDFAGLQLPQ